MAERTWPQIFQTMNPADSDVHSFGDRTEPDLVEWRRQDPRLTSATRPTTSPRVDVVVLRCGADDAAAIAGSATVGYDNAGWTELSNSQNGTNGFLAYHYCHNGQCGYDDFISSPASQLGSAPAIPVSCGWAVDELRRVGGVCRPTSAFERPHGDPFDQCRHVGSGSGHLGRYDGDPRRRAAKRGHPRLCTRTSTPSCSTRQTPCCVCRLGRRRGACRRPLDPVDRSAVCASSADTSQTTPTIPLSHRGICPTASGCLSADPARRSPQSMTA